MSSLLIIGTRIPLFRSFLTFAGIAIIAGLFAGCVLEKKEDPTVARAAIDAANKQFMDAFSRADAAAIATLYVEDGQLLPPGAEPVDGRDAIEMFWRGTLALPVREMQLHTVEISGAGPDVSELGRYVIVGDDGNTLDSGKYIVIWKRETGGWRIYRDIWNSSSSATTVPPAAPSDSTR